jgi:hypothetical protein
MGESELPLGGTVDDLRRAIALDAQRMGRRAIRMHDEIRRGARPSDTDRLELAAAVAKGSRYAWATLALIGYGMKEDALRSAADDIGLTLALAHVAQEVISEGEPSDPAYLRIVED